MTCIIYQSDYYQKLTFNNKMSCNSIEKLKNQKLSMFVVCYTHQQLMQFVLLFLVRLTWHRMLMA